MMYISLQVRNYSLALSPRNFICGLSRRLERDLNPKLDQNEGCNWFNLMNII